MLRLQCTTVAKNSVALLCCRRGAENQQIASCSRIWTNTYILTHFHILTQFDSCCGWRHVSRPQNQLVRYFRRTWSVVLLVFGQLSGILANNWRVSRWQLLYPTPPITMNRMCHVRFVILQNMCVYFGAIIISFVIILYGSIWKIILETFV